jgi:hypothetical protein
MDYGFLPARSPYGRHLFVGGNTLMPAILRDNASALRVTAPPAAFDATIAAARSQLRYRTARLSLATAQPTPSTLDVAVRVENLCGHKFPTGYPSRRAWLRVRVRDSGGNLVFSSGEWRSDGLLVDGAGAPLPSELAGGPHLPHFDVVSQPGEVQVFETTMDDVAGQPTFRLLRAASYRKDDRILPQGWSPTHPDAAHTAPAGVAGDLSFQAGSDTVTYQVSVAGAGPYTIEADLFYQPISPRHVAELATIDTPEIRAFLGYWQNATRTPELVDTATTTVP